MNVTRPLVVGSAFCAFVALAFTAVNSRLAGRLGIGPFATADWTSYGQDIGGAHFLNVDDINPSNVARLKPSWIFHTGVMDQHTNFEAQPIEANGIVYISSPYDHVFAVDAETGALKWTYNPQNMPDIAKLAICCGVSNRGVALGDGKVFIARLDARLVALDANTGKLAWETEIDPWQENWTETAAPLFVNNRVIIGASGGEFQKRGHVDAYDANTGKRLWRFYTIPGPGETGHDSWYGDSWKNGGATVWSTPVADQQLGLVYFGTGNAAPDMNGASRGGDNLFANSLVALDLNSGRYKWHFQEVHHDLWDYDAAQPAVLFDFGPDSRRTPAIAHCNKNGYCFILDRRNGKPLFPVEEQPVSNLSPEWQLPSPTQPVPAIAALIPQNVEGKPKHFKPAPMFTPPGRDPVLIQPGWEAGPGWSPSAYSPRTHYEYIDAGGYQPWLYHADPYVSSDVGSVALGRQPGVSNYGLFDALDTTTGRIAWQNRAPDRVISGALVAGDLVFYGESSGKFDAVDARSGSQLWSFQSQQAGVGGANASPTAYVRRGREYIVMAFGGNAHMRAGGQPGAQGDAVIAFALAKPDKKPREVSAHPIPVKTGFIPESAMIEPAQAPPAGANVIELTVANLKYTPSQFTVKTGQTVAIHLVVTQGFPAGIAMQLPNGPIALDEPVKGRHSAYFVFTAPQKPGTYSFFSNAGPERALGLQGSMVVTR